MVAVWCDVNNVVSGSVSARCVTVIYVRSKRQGRGSDRCMVWCVSARRIRLRGFIGWPGVDLIPGSGQMGQMWTW